MQKHLASAELRPVVANAENADEVDLLEIVRTLWRGKIWLALCVAVALALGWHGGVVASTPLSTTSAQLALQVSGPPAIDLEAVVSGFSGDEANMNTEMAIVRSGDLLGRLVNELAFDQDPEFNPHLINLEAHHQRP